MKQAVQVRGYWGGYLIGFIIIATVILRATLFFQGQANLDYVIACLVFYSFLYTLEPWLTSRLHWFRYIYFPLQTCAVIVLTSQRPFIDISSLFYIPLCLQVFRSFSRQVAVAWSTLFAALLSVTMMIGVGWLLGIALILLYLTFCVFLVSYDFIYSRTRENMAESQRLLEDLQSTYQKLEQYASQVEELAATRERNQVARDLHDSVSQAIFAVTLASQSTRLLLERKSASLPERMDQLQGMTSSVLDQLRSLIAELHPR